MAFFIRIPVSVCEPFAFSSVQDYQEVQHVVRIIITGMVNQLLKPE